MYKSGFATLIGRPNVGKSTLMNLFVGEKVSIVSDKPQTTRRNANMILSTETYQIVFIDTPGIHTPKNRLGEQMVRRAKNSVKNTDAVLLMIDARDDGLSGEDREIAAAARANGIPVILLINKIDLVKKDRLLPLISQVSAAYDFKSIIPISAIKAATRGLVLDEAVRLLPEGGPLYPEDMITDQTERRLAEDIIREKALTLLNQEVPHGVDVEIESFRMRERDGLHEIHATVYCEKEAHKKIIIGEGGATLKRIGASARIGIERLLETRVFLSLWVKVRKDWRNDDAALRRMGYFDT